MDISDLQIDETFLSGGYLHPWLVVQRVKLLMGVGRYVVQRVILCVCMTFVLKKNESLRLQYGTLLFPASCTIYTMSFVFERSVYT